MLKDVGGAKNFCDGKFSFKAKLHIFFSVIDICMKFATEYVDIIPKVMGTLNTS